VDTRAPGKVTGEVFFNHVSFLLFRLRAHEVEDLPALLESIKQQMYDQVKAGLAQDICEATLLMRIVPLPILSSLVRLYCKGEIASFHVGAVGCRLLGRSTPINADDLHSDTEPCRRKGALLSLPPGSDLAQVRPARRRLCGRGDRERGDRLLERRASHPRNAHRGEGGDSTLIVFVNALLNDPIDPSAWTVEPRVR
jgi:hypothetical protein